MIRERGKGATSEEVARTLQHFARAAESRKSHAHQAVVTRAMNDLAHAFEGLFKDLSELVLDVSAEALTFQGERVLEGSQAEGSIPLALHRDGIRRLSFSRGITAAELEAVVSATVHGLSFGGMGDDVVSVLWRRPLAHVRFEATDGSIEANGDEAARLHAEIERMAALVELPDPAGEPAQDVVGPAYREELMVELGKESDHAIVERAARVMTRAWKEAAKDQDTDGVSKTVLMMFDAALVDDNAKLATAIARGVQALPESERVKAWQREAASEARLRRLIPMLEDQPARQEEILTVVDAIGRAAVPALFALLPALQEAGQRRAVSERIVRYGIDDLGVVKDLINREPTYLANEGIFILGRIATPDAQSAIREVRAHPKLHVRLALVESLRHMPAELALAIALELLNKDDDPKVIAAIARSLPRYKTKETADALETAANKLTDRQLPYDTKLAVLVSFAAVNAGRAMPLLARYVKKGDGLLVRRDAEELAAAAVRAVGSIRGQRTNEILEKAGQSRSKLVKEAAREAAEQQAQSQGEPS